VRILGWGYAWEGVRVPRREVFFLGMIGLRFTSLVGANGSVDCAFCFGSGCFDSYAQFTVWCRYGFEIWRRLRTVSRSFIAGRCSYLMGCA